MKSCLIRVVALGGGGLIRVVAFGGGGLIRAGGLLYKLGVLQS